MSQSAKTKRAITQDQKSAAFRIKYLVLPACDISCRKCNERVSDESRREINEKFWSSTYNERKLWLNSYIHINDVKRHYTGTTSRKQHSLTYFLPRTDGKKQHVCKDMFLATLGWKSDGVVSKFIKSKTRSGTHFKPKDERGKATPMNKVNEQPIIEHINSFNPQISHYRREHAPNRRYLEPHLSIRFLWQNFTSKNGHIAYETYRKVFEKEKITFGQPPQDECVICLIHTQHIKDIENLENHDERECEICTVTEEHKRRASQARSEYNKPLMEDVASFSVDMQKIILLPKLTTKEHFLWAVW